MSRIGRAGPIAIGALVLGVGAACGASASSPTYATTPTAPGPIDLAALPLGDGYVSSTPKVGYVDSCMTSFPPTGGATGDGPWIDTQTHTWDSLSKIHVGGAVSWPTASYVVQVKGSRRVIRFDDLPIDHATGVFPIRSSDPAYQYDMNPNRIEAHELHWSLPLHPHAARAPSCTGGGPIGVLDDGVVLFNALDGEGRDAGAHEILDACGGHPDMSDLYHHHEVPPCIYDRAPNGRATLVGYALDGYGIYVVKNAHGVMPTNTSLDACHGTTSLVPWDGRLTRVYHYVATLEYPYTVACFHGTPTSSGLSTGGPGLGGPP
ncbi:MAG TPA: YHYH protein [Solirubrobacteraceae bacterium]|nr:YHYH protein [Solirubrobacteraceae bacterium]